MASEAGEMLRRQVAERAYRLCEYCLIHEEDTFWGCQIDHIISRKHGGSTEAANLAWACACCNNAKGSDLGTLVGHPPELTRLFNPRSDRWSGSFTLDEVRIEPATRIGDATVKLLRLNEDSRLGERQALSEIGRYPTIEAMARMRE